jgi:hypothetical protein
MAPERESPLIAERTYHGIIPEQGWRKVIIREPGIRDCSLHSRDAVEDFNWGHNGTSAIRLANAFTADAFDNELYIHAFGEHFINLVHSLDPGEPFVLSRDRMVIEGLIVFEDLIRKVRNGEQLHEVIHHLIEHQNDTRKTMTGLLSKNALKNIASVHFGIHQSSSGI